MPDLLSTAFPAASGIQAGLGAIQSIVGLVNKGAAKREARELDASRPVYKIKDGVKDNLSLAGTELMNGMGARAENAYNQAQDRQMGTSIDAILRSGGNVNNIGDVFDSSNEGRLRLAQMQDANRLSQVQNLVAANTAMDNAKDTAFLTNEYGPWKDKVQANAAARQGAENQTWAGIGTVGQGLMGGLDQIATNKAYNNMLSPQRHYTPDPPRNYAVPQIIQYSPLNQTIPGSMVQGGGIASFLQNRWQPPMSNQNYIGRPAVNPNSWYQGVYQ